MRAGCLLHAALGRLQRKQIDLVVNLGVGRVRTTAATLARSVFSGKNLRLDNSGCIIGAQGLTIADLLQLGIIYRGEAKTAAFTHHEFMLLALLAAAGRVLPHAREGAVVQQPAAQIDHSGEFPAVNRAVAAEAGGGGELGRDVNNGLAEVRLHLVGHDLQNTIHLLAGEIAVGNLAAVLAQNDLPLGSLVDKVHEDRLHIFEVLLLVVPVLIRDRRSNGDAQPLDVVLVDNRPDVVIVRALGIQIAADVRALAAGVEPVQQMQVLHGVAELTPLVGGHAVGMVAVNQNADGVADLVHELIQHDAVGEESRGSIDLPAVPVGLFQNLVKLRMDGGLAADDTDMVLGGPGEPVQNLMVPLQGNVRRLLVDHFICEAVGAAQIAECSHCNICHVEFLR